MNGDEHGRSALPSGWRFASESATGEGRPRVTRPPRAHAGNAQREPLLRRDSAAEGTLRMAAPLPLAYFRIPWLSRH